MVKTEQLAASAEREGFLTHLLRSTDPAELPRMAASLRESGRRFSACVAAPFYDAKERYRPFTLSREESAETIKRNLESLRAAASLLSDDGLMFIYGLPAHLPSYATDLTAGLQFRYWIAIRTVTEQKAGGMRPEHTGLLVLSKPGARLNRVRLPHALCRYCRRALKDWGGKSHLMHPEGAALSDVWMDLVVDPRDRMPREVFERILMLASGSGRRSLLLAVTERAQACFPLPRRDEPRISPFNPLTRLGSPRAPDKTRVISPELIDKVHKAACLDVLKSIPSETVDMAFADPPFNLTKGYNGYSDNRLTDDYMGWCKRWLIEYERLLKPGGALFILNLPKWSARLADFLNRRSGLYLQSWIAWSSLPEPKGVLMPAHYSLLYYTKGEKASRFNYCSMENGWEAFDEAVFPPDRPDVCRRRSCIKQRRASGRVWRGELTDIWHDIHRMRVGRRNAPDTGSHPCATPERLLDRIIRLSTNPGDLVLDAFAGVGTSAFVARRLGRRFIAIEQDSVYTGIAERRVNGPRVRKPPRPRTSRRETTSKRALQLEMQRLALMLGRLPTRADVERHSRYDAGVIEAAFDSWTVALKAARTVCERPEVYELLRRQSGREQLELFGEEPKATPPLPDEASAGGDSPDEPAPDVEQGAEEIDRAIN